MTIRLSLDAKLLLSLWPAAVVIGALAGPPLSADSYEEPTDHEIVCLDLATGRLLWRAKPDRVRPPRITVVGGVVVVAPQYPLTTNLEGEFRWFAEPKEWSERRLQLLDARTGAPVHSPRSPSASVTRPLDPLPRNLTCSDGTRYEFTQGSTRHLTAVVDGQRVVVKRLERFVSDLHVFDDLVLFTFSKRAGGEVFAYRPADDRLAWVFDASKSIDVPEGGYTGIAIDGSRALISTAQRLFALDARTGRVLWVTALPEQNIRRFDAPWTTIARLDDRLVVQCYEDLFLLDAEGGRVIWAFDCGFMGVPWPTVVGDRFYLSPRGDFKGLERPELRPLPPDLVTTVSRFPSAVEITRRRFYYSLRFLSKRDVPAGHDIWWSLRPPPASSSGTSSGRRHTVVFHENYGNQRTEVDVTVPLARHGKVYVKSYLKADRVEFLEDGEVVIRKLVPRRWPPR